MPNPIIANLEAEQSVLGALLMDTLAVYQVMPILNRDDFGYEDHARIYEAIISVVKDGSKTDFITVTDWLQRHGQLDEMGRSNLFGSAYLAWLIDAVPTSTHAVEYANIVHEHSIRRQLIAVAGKIAKVAYDEPGEKALLESLSLVSAVNSKSQVQMTNSMDAAEEFSVQLQNFYDAKATVWGLSTGLKDLDDLTGGLCQEEYVIVAGRPGNGKTSLLLQIARHAADATQGVAFFSLEMGLKQLILRMACQGAKLNSKKVRQGDILQEEKDKLWQELLNIGKLPIWWCARSGITVPEIQNEVARLQTTKDIALVVVDYLQIIGSSSKENENARLTEISQLLQQIPKNQHCCLLVASQLSREIERRQEPVPKLSDLRGSGSIEQDSDMVLFIHRKDDSGECKMVLAKNRNGPSGVGLRDMVFMPEYTLFADKATASVFEEPF